MSGGVAKAIRWGALAGAVLLALGGGAALWLTRSPAGHRWATAQVTAALGPSVRFADAVFTLWPPPLAVALRDLELVDSAGDTLVRARRVLLRVRLRALVGLPPLLARVEVDEFDVTLTRAGEIGLGVRSLAGGGAADARAALDAQCPEVLLRRGRLLLRDARDAARLVQIDALGGQLEPTRPGARLTLEGGSAQLGAVQATVTLNSLAGIASAAFEAEIQASDASAAALAAWLPDAGHTLTMSGRADLRTHLSGRADAGLAEGSITLQSGRIVWRDSLHAAAPIVLTARGTWGGDGVVTATGNATIDRLESHGVVGTEVGAAYDLDAGGVTLRDLRWRALGGAWRQSGTVRLAETASVAGGLDAEGIDGAALRDLLARFAGEAAAPLRIDGTVRLGATVTGTIGESLGGTLDIALPQGTASWGTVQARAPIALTADVAVQGGAVTLANGHAQAAAVADRDLAAGAIDARFGLAGGVLQVDALRAEAFDGSWSASGSIPLAGGAPTATLSARGVNAAHIAKALLTGRHEEAGTAGDVDLDATLRDGRGTITLRLASPALTLGALQIARPADASGAIGWSGNTWRVTDGGASLSRLRLAGAQVDNVRAAFDTSGTGQLRIAPLTARAFGGGWTVRATLSRDVIDGTIRAQGIALDPLLTALDAGPRSEHGAATLQVTLHRPRGAAAEATVAVQLQRGRFLFDDLIVSAPARGTGSVRVDGADWAVSNAVISAADARYRSLHGTGATARLDFGPDDIRFADLRFDAAGAPWQASGTISLTEPPHADGAVSVARADPLTLLQQFGIDAPEFDADGLDLTLRARGPLGGDWQPALQGDGSMALRGGTITSTALLRAIVAEIVPRRPLTELGLPNRLNSLTQTFTLADGILRTDDFALRSDDYDLTAAGTIGLDGRLALQGEVTLTPNGIKKLFALSAVPIPGSSLLSLPTIPTRFAGTLSAPEIDPETAALAGSTARWFVEALAGAPVRVGRAVARPLERIVDGVRDLVVPATPGAASGPP